MPDQSTIPYEPRTCPGTTEHTCGEILAGENRRQIRCLQCSRDYNNERRRAKNAGVPFGIPKNQLELPIPWRGHVIDTDPAEQRTF